MKNKIIVLLSFVLLFLVEPIKAQSNDYKREWATFLYTITDHLVWSSIKNNQNFIILVIGNDDLAEELGKKPFEEGFEVLTETHDLHGRSPHIVFVDRSMAIANLKIYAQRFPASLIVTNHADGIFTYGAFKKKQKAFEYGAHIRAVENPLKYFEMDEKGINRANILMTTSLKSLFGPQR